MSAVWDPIAHPLVLFHLFNPFISLSLFSPNLRMEHFGIEVQYSNCWSNFSQLVNSVSLHRLSRTVELTNEISPLSFGPIRSTKATDILLCSMLNRKSSVQNELKAGPWIGSVIRVTHIHLLLKEHWIILQTVDKVGALSCFKISMSWSWIVFGLSYK